MTMKADAVISDCGLYRYSLTRVWGDGPECVFVMLNPSTADALRDDPTIRRCISFAKREGCGSLRVVNLFALRATQPDDMLLASDPMGPANFQHVISALDDPGSVTIAGWGAHWMAQDCGKALARNFNLMCLGRTKSGAPRHPLYVKSDTPLVPLMPTT